MKIAVSGKGGSGKTTIAGTLARAFGRMGQRVLAIDADSNPNLATLLGMSREEAAGIVPLPRDLLKEDTDASGNRIFKLAMKPDAIAEAYGVKVPDNVTLLVGGKVYHAGSG